MLTTRTPPSLWSLNTTTTIPRCRRLQKIIDQIKGNNQDQALDFALNGNYTKAGVVARTIRGQTYVAISLRVGKNL